MSIDIGCINSTSALRRPLPIADALPYAAAAGLLGLRIIPAAGRAASPTPQRHDVIRRFIDRLSLSRATASCQFPIAA